MFEGSGTIWLALSEFDDVWDRFERLSGTKRESMRPKLAKAAQEAKDAIDSLCKIGIVCKRLAIEGVCQDCIRVTENQLLTGCGIGSAFEDAKEILLFVVTLNGFSGFEPKDSKAAFFGDCWGSAYVECAEEHLKRTVETQLFNEGMKRTRVWCPGLAHFDMENQRLLFDILQPSEIGCELSDQMLMRPVKSLSGIMGVIPISSEEAIVPCNLCDCSDACADPDKRNTCHCA